MSLTTIPTELFCCVVASIESQLTLSKLAQCSHELYRRTIPHLYRHVTIQEGTKPNAKLQPLTLLLMQRPDLAGFVRSFTLHATSAWVPKKFEECDEFEEFEECEECEECEESDGHVDQAFKALCLSEEEESDGHVDQAFKIAVKALSLSEEEENNWMEQLSHTHYCSPDLFLALLLPSLVKVERLGLDLDNAPYLERIIGRAARGLGPFDIQPAFEALTVFVRSRSYENFEAYITMGFMASLLKLPAIQMISGGFANTSGTISGEDDDLSELASTSSSLTSLDIAAYALGTANLRHILRAPKALKNFSYRVSCYSRMDFVHLQHALAPQKTCLEQLFFDHHWLYASFYSEEDIDNRGPMTSFVGFSALRVFKSAAVFLISPYGETERDSLINIFPASLETLHLIRCQVLADLPDALEHLIAQKSPQQIPLLKTLILEDRDVKSTKSGVREGMQEIVSRLSRLGAAHGVSVELR